MGKAKLDYTPEFWAALQRLMDRHPHRCSDCGVEDGRVRRVRDYKWPGGSLKGQIGFPWKEWPWLRKNWTKLRLHPQTRVNVTEIMHQLGYCHCSPAGASTSQTERAVSHD